MERLISNSQQEMNTLVMGLFWHDGWYKERTLLNL